MVVIRYEGIQNQGMTLTGGLDKMAMDVTEKYDYVAYIDGSCAPKNPGGTAVSKFHLLDCFGGQLQTKHIESNILGSGPQFSNNVAEWGALISLLDYIKGNMFLSPSLSNQLSVLVKSDSMMLVQQVLGEFQVKGGLYKEVALLGLEKWKELKSRVKLDIVYIPREENLAHDVG